MSDKPKRELLPGEAEVDAWIDTLEQRANAMRDEPNIVINGQALTAAQAMAVRVAITSFHAEMAEVNVFGGDEHGRRMTSAYRDRLSEVLRLMP